MKPLETLRFALRGLSANKLRSSLTTLGILIGVAAVIVLIAVGTGSSQSVQNQISKLGSNTLTVTSTSGGTGSRRGGGGFAALFGGGAARGGAAGGGAASAAGVTGTVSSGTQTRASALTISDAEALEDTTLLPDVAGVAPTVSVSSVTATYDGATDSVNSFIGSTPSYLGIENDTVAVGTAFTDADYLSRRRVALIGTSVATALVGGTGDAAVGKVVEFNGQQFTVLGVLTSKGSTGPTDQDSTVIAPLPAVQDALAGYGSLASIAVQAKNSKDTTAAQTEIDAALNTAHKVTTATADYTVTNPTTILAAATSSQSTFTVLLGAVAGISLLVGGIGVMNIMLVNVTERTREIGIRKAIGARRGDIVGQFLLEAVLLSIVGGLAGVAVGLIGSQFKIVGVKPEVAPYSVFLAFGVSVVIGLFFGLYPANRAAALRPIDALRYE